MIQKLTPEQADTIIRASWPAHSDIDYSVHTGECAGNVGDECPESEPDIAGLILWALTLVAVALAIVAMVAL